MATGNDLEATATTRNNVKNTARTEKTPIVKPPMSKIARRVWKQLKKTGICIFACSSSVDDLDACQQIIRRLSGRVDGIAMHASFSQPFSFVGRDIATGGTWLFVRGTKAATICTKDHKKQHAN